MRKLQSVCLGIFGVVFLCAPWSYAGDSPWDKQLPFESATVDYTVSGTMTGDKTIYVKDFGRTMAEYSSMTMKMMGMTHRQEEVIITTPDWVYSADMTEGTGTKQINPQKCLAEEYNRLSASDRKKVVKNADAMGVSVMDGMGGTVEEKAATILGYPCDRVTMMGTTAYTISGSGLPLKMEGETMGVKISQVAKEMKTGQAPASKFQLPRGIQFVNDPETDRMIRKQARSVIQNLVAGKNPAAGGQAGAPSATAYDRSGDQGQGTVERVVEDDARDVGEAAHQEAKDAAVDQVREGVQKVFKSLFD